MVSISMNGTAKGKLVHNKSSDIRFTTRDPSPCYGCPDRYLACSDHCKKPEYLEWVAKKAIVDKNRKTYGYSAYIYNEKVRKRNSRK